MLRIAGYALLFGAGSIGDLCACNRGKTSERVPAARAVQVRGRRAWMGEACSVPLNYQTGGPSVIPPGTVPSALDLLGLPFVFTQTGLLRPGQFISEAKKRGFTLERSELEFLHRRRVLVPLYRVHARAIGPGCDRSPALQAQGTEWQVYLASSLGRLSDPAGRPFARWPRRERESFLLYSPYQLLSLRGLQWVMSRMRRTGENEWELDRLSDRELQHHARDRALAVALEVLATRYRPRITLVRRAAHDDRIEDLVESHDPEVESSVLTVPRDLLVRQADRLLSVASRFDPLGSWHRVTRIARPSRWEELRNDALLAQEYRMAAEMLLGFVEDEATRGRAKPLEPLSGTWKQPQHDRLKVDVRERAETIMDFALSDRPAVYLAVEGQTEVVLVVKVLELAGFEARSHWVSVVDLDGVGGDMNLLARSVAVPRLDPDGYTGARVLSPLTALLVVADPEGNYTTPADQAAVRASMIRHVLRSLPEALRTAAVERELEYLLHVRAWPFEFEFAHFTDAQLARALRKVAGDACPPDEKVREALRRCRAARSNINNVWKRWRFEPSKPELARALWPDLERKINRAKDPKRIPIVSVVVDVIRISHEVRRAREMNAPPG
jgi:hypothetical protein